LTVFNRVRARMNGSLSDPEQGRSEGSRPLVEQGAVFGPVSLFPPPLFDPASWTPEAFPPLLEYTL